MQADMSVQYRQASEIMESSHSLVEHSPDLMMRIKHTLHVTYVNPAIENLSSHAPNMLLGQRVDEVTFLRDLLGGAEGQKQLVCALDTGQEESFRSVVITPNGEQVFDVRLVPERKADGSVKDICYFAHDVTRYWQMEKTLIESEVCLQALDIINPKPDELALRYINATLEEKVQMRTDELVTANLALQHEIDEHKQSVQTLRQSEARYRALVDAIPAIVARIQANGVVLDAKGLPTFVPITAIEQTIGKNYLDISPPAIASLAQQAIGKALATGQQQTVEYEATVNGTTAARESTVVSINPNEAFLLTRDVTDRKQVEATLRQSEARYRALLEAIPDGIVRLRRDGLCLDAKVPKSFASAPPAEQIVGRMIGEIFPEALTTPAFQAIEEAIATGSIQVYEYSAEAELLVREARVVPIDHDEVIVIVRDVTERKRAEVALRASQERYRALVELSPDAIYINLHERLIYANPSFVKLIGASDAKQLIGKSPFELFHPEDHALIRARRQRLVDDRRPLPIVELRLIRLDGLVKDVDATGTVYEDQEGLAYQVILRDITERKQAQAALRESEERYRTLVEMSPDAILINRQNQIVYANPACLRLLGASTSAELLGKSPLDLLVPSYHAVAKQRIEKLLREGGIAPPLEYSLIRLDGTCLDVELSAALIQDQGESAIQVFFHDVTTRRESEAENQKLLEEVMEQRAQLRFLNRRLAETQDLERRALARELHDQVGSNLSLLAINVEMLQKRCATIAPTDDLIQGRFENVQSLLQQTNQRTRDIMSDLWPSELDDYGLLAALEWYADRLTRYSQLEIIVEGNEAAPRPIPTIEWALFRVAQEALTNVVKHANASHVSIHLTTTAQQILLSIMDDGQGFELSHSNQTRQTRHWGLLNLYERTHAVNGELQIVTHPGHGTAIFVEVPLIAKGSEHTEEVNNK